MLEIRQGEEFSRDHHNFPLENNALFYHPSPSQASRNMTNQN